MSKASDAERGPQTPGSRTSKRARRWESGSGNDDRRPDPSTGLTPHISRTRLIASSPIAPTVTRVEKQSAQSRQRRHTTPYPQSDHRKRKLGAPSSPTEEVRTYQYIPFHDIIDLRTRRRINRSGFSEEINRIEEKRRIQKKIEKEREEELRTLKDELDRLRRGRVASDDVADKTDDESEEERGSGMSLDSEGDDDGFGFDSNADPFEPVRDFLPSMACLPISIDAGTQVSFHSCLGEVQSLKEDLERKKMEQRKLFQEWQGVFRSTSPSDERNGIETGPTPPPDLTVQVIASLRAAITRATEAAQTVETVQKELSSHGFNGIDAMEVITNIGDRFRHARVELERAVPGETPNANLSNWSATIDALVERISRLVADLKRAQQQVTGYQEREVVLRRQFDAALLRFEETSKKNENLEKYTAMIAEDMLNARMKLQRLGKELQSHATDKNRLIAALEDYRDDVKTLEQLNSKLEDEFAASRERVEDLEIANNKLDEKHELSKARIASLERNLTREQVLRQKVQADLDQCDLEISSLKQRTHQLEIEYEQAISALKEANTKESENHEEEVGALNVRLSSITTSLSDAKVENQQLHEQKGQLERRLLDFQHLFSQEAIHAAKEKAKETVEALEEWQRGIELLDHVSRNEEVAADKRYNFCAIGSEPITPATVSRFTNVEIGRGKKRKRNINHQIGTVREEREDWLEGSTL